MEKSSKTTPAVRSSPGRKRANAERTGASKVNDRVQEVVEGLTEKPAARAARSGNGEWMPPWDEVARRAYELYQRRGGTPGRDVEDWLEAERQVRGSYGR
jgi:hypothetical protein